MDRLDRLSLLAIVLLAVAVSFLVAVNAGGSAGGEPYVARPQAPVFNPELDKKVRVARDLMENNNLAKSEELATLLLQEYPYDGKPHMIMGDIRLRQQDPLGAMDSYRSAVDLTPDFLDKKSELFQGRKIKAAVQEARAFIEKELQAGPRTTELAAKRKAVYYMLRRIAGSCG
jgi:cytochrome c-type biogenesis protein CcmH/NrfG